MEQRAYGSWNIGPKALDDDLRGDVVAALEEQDYRIHRRSLRSDRLKVVGIRGRKWVAILANIFPLTRAHGRWSRVKASVVCRKSLDEGDDDLHLTVKCVPVAEDDSMQEVAAEQRGREAAGDMAQTRRCFSRLVDLLRERAIIGGVQPGQM